MGFSLDIGPDVSLDDLYDTWLVLAGLEEELQTAEQTLERFRAECKARAMRDKDLWLNDKPPTAEYLRQVVHYVGNDQDDAKHIAGLEQRLAQLRGNYTQVKGRLDTLQNKIRVWQTMSANARKVIADA